MYALLESRTKEAMWLGELDLAEARARELVELTPLDAKARIELGEVLLERGQLEAAGVEYRTAARLGPPGTAIAWFMAGQCDEARGQLDLAFDAYLASTEADPLGVSAFERVAALASGLGVPALRTWALAQLNDVASPEPQAVS
jgi:tetratricopeptide (TPR) repeat protein